MKCVMEVAFFLLLLLYFDDDPSLCLHSCQVSEENSILQLGFYELMFHVHLCGLNPCPSDSEKG